MNTRFSILGAILKRPFYAPEDGAPAGGDPAPATPPAGEPAPPAGDPAPATPPATPPASGEPAGGQKWWESDKLSADQRTVLTASGLTVDDPLDAVAKLVDMERAAQRKLGSKPDQLIQRPKDGQDLSAWMHENREMFGIPENAEGYEIKPPEGFGDGGLQWDKDLEGQARAIAHKHGLGGAALQELSDLYAGKVRALATDAGDQLAKANREMMASLQSEWGPQTDARLAQARAGAEALAAAAGLDNSALLNIGQVLSRETGDAATIKLFQKVGEMMAEDTTGLIRTQGGALTTTPADARAELAKMRAPGGAYYEAVAKGDQAEVKRLAPRIAELDKIASA